ncbi:MAG TPA: flagellar basal body P-ring formation chaperone FlgA [Bryobacteraceae bacterium]|nr:flagellar basal body P-ring formation chaperone FlgA [Bryobacteraceae bacterium]
MLALLIAAGACLPLSGDRILMGDLAAAIPSFKTLDAREAIGYTPAPGAIRRFSAGELDRLAERHGIALRADPVCFEREMETLTEERIVTALRAVLPQGAQLELLDFSRESVPKGILEFSPSGLTPAPAGAPRQPALWRGRVKYGRRQSVTVWARTRAWIAGARLVAARDLEAGKPLEPGQLRTESVEQSPFAASERVSPEAVTGLAPRRRIAAGQPVLPSALEAPADVARGAVVHVKARFGAATLQFEARAEAPGRIGDRIPLRNPQSNKTFYARVVRKNRAEVE